MVIDKKMLALDAGTSITVNAYSTKAILTYSKCPTRNVGIYKYLLIDK